MSVGITFDTNRLTHVAPRRFNVAWREFEGDKVHVLPKVASELMGHAIRAERLEEGADSLRRELVVDDNRLGEQTKRHYRRALWWAEELMRADSPYVMQTLSHDQLELSHNVCAAIDRRVFERLGVFDDIGEHADAIIVSQALASNTRLLMTADTRINVSILDDWVVKHGREFGVEAEFGVVLQDEFFQQEYTSEEDFLELFAVVLGAYWPFDEHASNDEVLGQFQDSLRRLEEGETGLRKTAELMRLRWGDEPRKDMLVEYVRNNLPSGLRASEDRHPSLIEKRHSP